MRKFLMLCVVCFFLSGCDPVGTKRVKEIGEEIGKAITQSFVDVSDYLRGGMVRVTGYVVGEVVVKKSGDNQVESIIIRTEYFNMYSPDTMEAGKTAERVAIELEGKGLELLVLDGQKVGVIGVFHKDEVGSMRMLAQEILMTGTVSVKKSVDGKVESIGIQKKEKDKTHDFKVVLDKLGTALIPLEGKKVCVVGSFARKENGETEMKVTSEQWGADAQWGTVAWVSVAEGKEDVDAINNEWTRLSREKLDEVLKRRIKLEEKMMKARQEEEARKEEEAKAAKGDEK
jgi:hypothetical protein